jgi:hypothetical protein
MPGIALHLLCASQVLRRWIRTPPAAPIAVHDPAVVDAFFQGSLGPDMGYAFGGGMMLSDLDSGLPAPVAIETVDRMVPPTVTSPRPGSDEREPRKPRPRRAA